MRTLTSLGALMVIVALLAACGSDDEGAGTGGATVDTQHGADLVASGEQLYQDVCAACHGADLRGTDTGPPFLDPVYAPNHHADEAFYAAVENGVQPHHWEFGPMPPQPSVDADEVEAIVAYVRARQAEEGITEDPDHP